MRLRIRTLLLTVALLCAMTSTASACIYIPILDPFYWLFGGCGGYNGIDYGYVNTGNSYGYGPNPYGVSRCIDDWLGYGYLRNQEGTLGHYPGRPVSCYHPVFPRLLNPCSWFAPCPMFAPYGPSCAMTAPMVAPLSPAMSGPAQMPYQAQWPMPMPGMVNPYAGNCNDPCESPYMPQPMLQYQPAPLPMTSWRPMHVHRGRLRRARLYHRRAMMMPQTQYGMSAPAMQMPMMQNPIMDSGCCGDFGGSFGDDCGCSGDTAGMMPGTEYMPGAEMMPGAEIMQGSGYPDMNSGSGCCGSNGGLPQSEYESGSPAVPQSTMLMSPGLMPMSRMSMGQPNNIAPYTSLSRWYSNPGYSTAWNNPAYRQTTAFRPTYGTVVYRQPQSGNFATNSAMMPMPQGSGWQTVPTRSVQMPMSQIRTAPMTVHMMPPQFRAMPSQHPVSSMIGGTMQGNVYARPVLAGDIHGDHEWPGPASASAPIIQNSFNGRPPVQQASWSQPARITSAKRYPNSVQ